MQKNQPGEPISVEFSYEQGGAAGSSPWGKLSEESVDYKIDLVQQITKKIVGFCQENDLPKMPASLALVRVGVCSMMVAGVGRKDIAVLVDMIIDEITSSMEREGGAGEEPESHG